MLSFYEYIISHHDEMGKGGTAPRILKRGTHSSTTHRFALSTLR